MNSLNDGIDFLNIKKNKYNKELNKVNLTQNNTSGYKSIIENLDNMSSASLTMNRDLNSDELSRFQSLDNNLKTKIINYNQKYKELENLINDLNKKINERNNLNVTKLDLEDKLNVNNNLLNDYNNIISKINNINIEIENISKNVKTDIDNLISMNNDIKNISSGIVSNINSLNEKSKIHPIGNKLIIDGVLKMMIIGIDSLKKLKLAIEDINNYTPTINGKKIILSDLTLKDPINKYNDEIKDNYKYVNINSSAMSDDSLKFNKYERYQYIIWFIFIVIILLMVYKSITDYGPISLTTGLFSLTFLFLFYYIVTLFTK